MEPFGLSTRSSHIDVFLPPCRVCGEKASGLHYGVYTCEACKRFFGRTKRSRQKLVCLKQQKCEPRHGGRSRCTYCRYQKCIQLGMSIEARQLGRYPSQQRTHNTLEAKAVLDAKINAMMAENRKADFRDPDYSLEYIPLTCPCGKNRPDVIDDLDATIVQVCAASKLYSLIWKPFHRDKDIWNKQVEFCQNRRNQERAHGYVEPFGHCIGMDAYQSLGIDTANERNAMLVVSYHLEKCIVKVIKFAKAIPGFKRLPLDDQANLVKYSRFEYWMTMSFSAINTKLNVTMAMNGNLFHREDMEYLFSKDYIANIYLLASRFESIGLTNEELAILQAIVLTFTDRSDLKRPDLVAEIQDNLVACFECLLKRNHGTDYWQFLMRTVDSLVEVRTLTERNLKLCLNMASEWPEIQRSPLLLELFTM